MFNPLNTMNIVVDESTPAGTLYLVPPVEHVRYVIESTGEEKEYLQWGAKQAGIIFNIGKDKL